MSPDILVPVEETFGVYLSEREMQAVANAVTALMNIRHKSGWEGPPPAVEQLIQVLQKFQRANSGNSIVVPR